MNTQTCPVCQGKQKVPYWFYNQAPKPVMSVATRLDATIPCRSCNGLGYIQPDLKAFEKWLEEKYEHYSQTNWANNYDKADVISEILTKFKEITK